MSTRPPATNSDIGISYAPNAQNVPLNRHQFLGGAHVTEADLYGKNLDKTGQPQPDTPQFGIYGPNDDPTNIPYGHTHRGMMKNDPDMSYAQENNPLRTEFSITLNKSLLQLAQGENVTGKNGSEEGANQWKPSEANILMACKQRVYRVTYRVRVPRCTLGSPLLWQSSRNDSLTLPVP